MDLAGAGEVAMALGLFELGAEAVYFLFDFAVGLDGVLFLEPAGFHGGGGFLEFCDGLLELVEALEACGVGLFLEDEALHF